MRRRHALLLGGALAVGIACGLVADRSLASVAALLFEPFLWIAALTAALFLALRRHIPRAAFALAAVTLFSIGVRAVGGGGSAPPAASRFAELGRCAGEVQPRSLRVGVWNVLANKDAAKIIEAASELDADVLILHEVEDPAVGRTLAQRWGGESIHEPAMLGWGTTVVVRDGRFVECDGRTHTVNDLAAEPGRRAISVAATVETAGGRVPIVTLHTDRPATLREAARWPRRMSETARRVASAIRGLDHPAVVVGGDTNTHATFHRFHGTLESVGIAPAPTEATWPAVLGGVPVPPLYSLDRIWTGPAWQVADLRSVRTSARSDHLAILAELRP